MAPLWGLSWRCPSPTEQPLIWAVAILFTSVSCCWATCASSPLVPWRRDGRCGRGFSVFASSAAAECDPSSERPCCSDYGYCGRSRSHCACAACVDFRNVVTRAGCHFPLEDEQGYLQSPGYPKPYPVKQDCCYDIHRPSEEFCGVSLLVENLDVGRGEEEGFCQQDWLSLPSCVPERGTRICGNETGQYFQYLFQPGASAIRFQFHAGNVSEGRTGFKIRYSLLRQCPGPFQTPSPPITPIPSTDGAPPCFTRITDGRGTINTPFFPAQYPPSLDCVYEFVRTKAQICGVKMQSVRFELEDPLPTPFGGACADFLHLPSCGFLCGNVTFSWLVHFQPGATSLKFHFHSNHNNSSENSTPSRGFLINFEQVTECY